MNWSIAIHSHVSAEVWSSRTTWERLARVQACTGYLSWILSRMGLFYTLLCLDSNKNSNSFNWWISLPSFFHNFFIICSFPHDPIYLSRFFRSISSGAGVPPRWPGTPRSASIGCSTRRSTRGPTGSHAAVLWCCRRVQMVQRLLRHRLYFLRVSKCFNSGFKYVVMWENIREHWGTFFDL